VTDNPIKLATDHTYVLETQCPLPASSTDINWAVGNALRVLSLLNRLDADVVIEMRDGTRLEVPSPSTSAATTLSAIRAAPDSPDTDDSAVIATILVAPALQPLDLHIETHLSGDCLTIVARGTGAGDETSFLTDTIIGQVARLVSASFELPDSELSAFDSLGPADREVLRRWNGARINYPDETLHGMFVAQARLSPDAVAIVDGEAEYTYAEVDKASNRIAHALLPAVMHPGDVVSVYGPRNALTLIAQIGVMKAGAAFLYLDPEIPATRNAQMIDIAGSVAMLTSPGAPWPGASTPGENIDMERTIAEGAASSDAVPDRANGGSAAFVLFTSGSTGQPKGVVRPHRMQTTRVRLEQSMYRLTSEDRHLMKAVPFFREFFWALATGGTVVVAKPGGERDDAYLTKLIRDEGITVASFVPSMLRVLLENKDFARGALPIKHLFTAGESFDAALESELRSIDIPVHVTYTLAEADYVTHRTDSSTTQLGTVGRPLDMQIYLCDTHGGLAAPGLVGEIYTAGPGLAIGYIGRPDLTAERFLPNRFDPEHHPFMFKTGDLARFRADGQVEFIGRADSQVKIRGQRVEPTEVEHVIREFPAVRNALVSTLPDSQQGHILIAYITGDEPGLERDLKPFLSDRLPSVMVPSYIVQVAELPLLISGKLDRASMAVSLSSRPSSMPKATEPENDLERAIVDTWQRVLGVFPVGTDDTFTSLGGDSLKAMLLRIALEDTLGHEIDLASLMNSPTIYEFTQALEHSR
jgi:amino acid adenylation domain-containing protein